MIALSLRQFRNQGVVALVLLALVAVVYAVTGPHLAHIYYVSAKAAAACTPAQPCSARIKLSTFYGLLELIGTLLVAVPALIGAFWGRRSSAVSSRTGRTVWPGPRASPATGG